VIDEDDFWSNWWNEDWQGKPKYSEQTCPSATLSTTKSHMTYSLPYIITMIKSVRTRWAEHIARFKIRNTYVMLTGMFEGKKPLGTLTSLLEDDSKINHFFNV
jgi:hypothetical protein